MNKYTIPVKFLGKIINMEIHAFDVDSAYSKLRKMKMIDFLQNISVGDALSIGDVTKMEVVFNKSDLEEMILSI